MNLLLLFLVVSTVLVLKSGHRIEVEGVVQEQGGRAVFRVPGGGLHSLPLSDIDMEATRALAEAKAEEPERAGKLKVTPEERDRLLRELSSRKNTAKPSPPPKATEKALPPAATAVDVVEKVESRRDEGREQDQEQEEWRWRREARAHEENVRQAQENLDLLRQRADQLRSEISSFLSLGYHPRQFTYQTSTLQYVLEQIPVAELEVRRAQRAYEDFREEARRRGIMPGWLR